MLSGDELQHIFLLLFALEFLMLMGYLTFDMEHFYNENQFVVKSYCTIDTDRLYFGSKDWTSLGKVIHNLSISIKRASEMGTEVCLVGSRHYFGKKSITPWNFNASRLTLLSLWYRFCLHHSNVPKFDWGFIKTVSKLECTLRSFCGQKWGTS